MIITTVAFLVAASAAGPVTDPQKSYTEDVVKYAWYPEPAMEGSPFAYVTVSRMTSADGVTTRMEWSDNADNPIDPALLHTIEATRDGDGQITDLYWKGCRVGEDEPLFELVASRNANGILTGVLQVGNKPREWTLAAPNRPGLYIDPIEALTFERRTPERFWCPALTYDRGVGNSFVSYTNLGMNWTDQPFNNTPGRYQVTRTHMESNGANGVHTEGKGVAAIRDQRGRLLAMTMPEAMSYRVEQQAGANRVTANAATSQSPVGSEGGFLIRLPD